MIRIDLGKDAEERLKSRKPEKKAFSSSVPSFKLEKSEFSGLVLLVGSVALALLPFLFVGQYKDRVVANLNNQMKELQENKVALEQEIEKYKSYKTELENFEKQSALINQRLVSVNELLQTRGGPVNVLDALGQSLPPGVWLTQIELNALPQPSLFFNGSAFTNEEVTDYSEKLGSSIYLEKIELKELTGSKNDKGDEIKMFSFTAVPKGFGIKLQSDRDTAGAK